MKNRQINSGPLKVDFSKGVAVGENRKNFVADFGATICEYFLLGVKSWGNIEDRIKHGFIERLWIIFNMIYVATNFIFHYFLYYHSNHYEC